MEVFRGMRGIGWGRIGEAWGIYRMGESVLEGCDFDISSHIISRSPVLELPTQRAILSEP